MTHPAGEAAGAGRRKFPRAVWGHISIPISFVDALFGFVFCSVLTCCHRCIACIGCQCCKHAFESLKATKLRRPRKFRLTDCWHAELARHGWPAHFHAVQHSREPSAGLPSTEKTPILNSVFSFPSKLLRQGGSPLFWWIYAQA